MIGVFDSGLGGLTVLRVLVARFPEVSFCYLADHANVPYGERPSREIVDLTRVGASTLFAEGCRLVLLGCNTATAIAARTLQKEWLPATDFRGRNVLGIVAPTVEAATQTPWAVTTPQYPQKYNADTIVVFVTTLTVTSLVYVEEIAKRCPNVRVHQQPCPGLAGAIERGAGSAVVADLVRQACTSGLAAFGGHSLDRAILGCTHYPIVEAQFRQHLPAATRILSQPNIVADSLEDYLQRHPHYAAERQDTEFQQGRVRLLTTGHPQSVTEAAKRFWPEVGRFEQVALTS